MSFNYQAFLEDEGVPTYFQDGSPSGLFDSIREGSVRLAGIADTVSWQDFLLNTPGVRDIPFFVESELTVVYDQALCGFGHRKQGLVFRNEALHSMFQPNSLRQGLAPQMLELAGWWSVYFPWDHKALLRYQPAELAWFLFKQVNSGTGSQRVLSPLRISIAMLTIQPWGSLMNWCGEYGILCYLVTPGRRSLSHHTIGMWHYARYGRHVMQPLSPRACRCGYRGWATRYMMLCCGAALNNRAQDFWTTRSSGCYWNVVWGLPWIRSPLGQRALSQRVLIEGPLAGGDQLVRYPFLRSSLAATGEVPVSDDTPLRAFTWLFAIKNVFVLMEGTVVEPGVTWRWYLFPLKRDIQPAPHVGQVDLSRVGSSSVSAADLVQGMKDVDLDMIAGSSFAVQGSRNYIGTLQSMFQKRTRCEGLNDPVPSSATRFVVGLEKILCWGALPLVVRGDSVVLPFASEDGAKGIIRWLETGTGVFTWAFLYSSISLGLLRVESINNYSYVCTF